MSKPRYGWWSYVKDMIRRYPALCEAHEEELRQRVTQSYSEVPGSGKAERGTEQTVARAMTRIAVREYEAVSQAIEQTRQSGNGEAILRMIRLVYWNRSHTLSGAAMAVYISLPTAKRWHGAFIRLVARNFGLLD